MSAELRPLGVQCNIQCQYCYQNPQRDAGNLSSSYDMEKMKEGVEKVGRGFTLFGGEALLVPEKDLEELWSWGLQKYGSNGVQTNGTLINDNHIRMFKQYKVGVGISIDGPKEMNDVRWNGTLARTREATAKTERSIEKLCDESIPPSLIVTLHRANATSDKLPRMREWFLHLDKSGIRDVRLHILEVDDRTIGQKYALTAQENIEAYLYFAELEKEFANLRFDMFGELRDLLLGFDNHSTCVWNACDPLTTRAVQGVEGNGQTSNCGRTNKDGIDVIKADVEGFERYVALYHTPQENNGCSGCRFFSMCKGQCPGTAIEGDWRNKTEHCLVWFTLFEHFEQQLCEKGKMPLSLSPLRINVEQALVQGWIKGDNFGLNNCLMALASNREGAPALHEYLEANQIEHSFNEGIVNHVDHAGHVSI